MLDHLCIKDSSVSSKFPKSLFENERKQNDSQLYQTIHSFAFPGSSCLPLCEEEIKKDTDLRKQWDKTFDNVKLTAVTEEDSIKISKVELYENIVSRFLNISNNKFRKDIFKNLGKKNQKDCGKKVVSKEANQ